MVRHNGLVLLVALSGSGWAQQSDEQLTESKQVYRHFSAVAVLARQTKTGLTEQTRHF